MGQLAVFTTVGDEAAARRLARAAVEARLAACVQCEPIHSVYRWDGAVQEEPEVRLMFKTTEAAWPALRALIAAQHPYALPAIFALPVVAADAPYAAWVAAEVAAHHPAADAPTAPS